MAEYLKVKNYTGLVRDVYSNAIIREKSSEYEMYMQGQIQKRETKDEIINVVREINNLKKELNFFDSLCLKTPCNLDVNLYLWTIKNEIIKVVNNTNPIKEAFSKLFPNLFI